MVTINLTEQNARALQDALHKFNAHMLGERKFTPTYAEVMAAIEAANQINTQTTSN